MDQNSHSWGTFLCFRDLLEQSGPVEKERIGYWKWGSCLTLQVTLLCSCGLVRQTLQQLPKGSQTTGWDFSLSHWSARLGVNCDVLAGSWYCTSETFHSLFCFILLFSKTVSSSTSYPFQKFLEFPSLFLLLYLMFSSFNYSFYAKPGIFCMGRGEKEIRGNKRFYFEWKLGRVWCQLPDTTRDLKKSPLARHPRTCFLLSAPPLSPWKCCALHQITFCDIPLPSL